MGFTAGLGAASADAIYGMVAAFGLTTISNFLFAQQIWFRWIGGLFLIYLGLKILLFSRRSLEISTHRENYLGGYLSTFLLTLTNPMTILMFAAVFSGFGFVSANPKYTAGILWVVGVFSGSSVWWLILSSVTGILRRRMNPQSLRGINYASGGAIIGFGVYAFFSTMA